jgi:SAM-dependent methyltransferase
MSQNYPADLYDAVHLGTPGDVSFYRRECAGVQSVLELGCGSGRVLAAVDEDERRLVGLDTSEDALQLAAARVPRAQLVRGAMQELALKQRFDRIVAPFSALYCLTSGAELDRTLRAAVRHLAAGGRFVADVWNAEEFHVDGDPADDEPSPLVQVEARGTTYYVYESSRWDRERQLVTASYEYRAANGSSIFAEITHRYFLRAELERALAHSGATSWRLESDFEGAPWKPSSELTVIRAAM